MKITLDTKTKICKVGSKEFKDAKEYNQREVISQFRNFVKENSKLSDYEMDCMWMSYRYCIGRHTIASHMHAGDIWANCKNRISNERALFTAFDINREIEQHMMFVKPYFHFPLTSLNRIYTSAIDIFCEFLEDFKIENVDDLIKYRDVYIKLYDNERGYTFETVTWEEWLSPQVHNIVSKYYGNDCMSVDLAWKYFVHYMENPSEMKQEELVKEFKRITIDIPKPDNYYLHDIEDLFVWNDLVHCFDYEHYHKSLLKDGTEVEWFWSWTRKSEESKTEPGKYYYTFGYDKIRVPVDMWNGHVTTYLSENYIEKDIY